MHWRLSIAVGLLLVLLVSVPVGAQGGQPTLPWTVYGKVTNNGVLADAGVLVEARNPLTGAQCGQTSVITGGDYTVDVEASGQVADCFNDGDSVQFWVLWDGVFHEAQQTPAAQTFQSGEVLEVNLSIDTGPLTSCPDFVSPPVGVGVEDVQAIGLHWREQKGDPDWDPRFDRDVDGRVTTTDIMMVVTSWGPCP